MDATAFISRIRDHYVDQLRKFAEQQQAIFTQGAAEVKLLLNEESALFQNLYCVDFIGNDDGPQLVELQPDFLTFQPVSATFGTVSLSIERFRWDDVIFYHNAGDLPFTALSAWFRQWFDPEDERVILSENLSGVIHSLSVEPGTLNLDFGSAEVEAFWDMLQMLADAGASNIKVSGSVTDAKP